MGKVGGVGMRVSHWMGLRALWLYKCLGSICCKEPPDRAVAAGRQHFSQASGVRNWHLFGLPNGEAFNIPWDGLMRMLHQ